MHFKNSSKTCVLVSAFLRQIKKDSLSPFFICGLMADSNHNAVVRKK